MQIIPKIGFFTNKTLNKAFESDKLIEEYDLTIDITGDNNISMLRLSDSKFSVTGSGSLKFKQNSFVKKVINGEAVYQYVYKDKMVIDENKKIYSRDELQEHSPESYDGYWQVPRLVD